MDKQYKNLMEQQNIGEEVNAEFYAKLEKTKTRRKSLGWKVALIAACLAMLIPLTAFAVENIFRVPEVKLGDTVHFVGMNGYMVRFEGMDSYPLSVFPEEVQHMTEIYKCVACSSWEAAEEKLGIDLLNNSFLANASRITMKYDDLGTVHSRIMYSQYEGQLFYVSTSAYYKYDEVQLNLNAKLTVEHPAMTEEDKQALLGVEGAVTKPENVETTYENYTTKDGIPVVILRWEYEPFDRYMALFAVNDITYELTAYASSTVSDDIAKQTLLTALDGFELK